MSMDTNAERVWKMSLDEVRDAIAAAKYPHLEKRNGGWWFDKVEWRQVGEHPVPATLDSAAACMPEAWTIDVQFNRHWPVGKKWAAFCWLDEMHDHSLQCWGDTELLARFRLALLCILANKEMNPHARPTEPA